MNFFSRFKKIFLISFLVCVLSGSAIFAAAELIAERAYKVTNEFEITVGLSSDDLGEGSRRTVNLNEAQSSGTGGVWEFSEEHQKGIRAAYTLAGINFDDTGLNMSQVYLNKTSAGVSYIDRSSGRIVAVSTPAGTFIPRGIAKKDDVTGRRFFNVVDTASGYQTGDDNTPGTIENSYIHADDSDENTELQVRNQENINAEVKGLRATVEQSQKNLDELIARNAPATEIDAARAKLQADTEALNRGLANKARQDGVVAGIANTAAACDDMGSLFEFNCYIKGLSFIALIVFKLATFVLGLAGSLLDYSIELSVNSAEFLASLNIVNPMWTFVRDILNMSFIFILLWIAINMVLGRSGIGSAKTYTIKNDVRNVVLVAILINFSLFFAKIFVDGSNLVTLELYQQMKPAPSAAADGQTGISDQIMNTVGLTALVNITDVFNTTSKDFPPACQAVPELTLSVGVFGTIFVLILAVAFGLAAILFFIRLPNMIYLFISSPLWIWGHVMKGGVFDEAKKSWTSNMFHLCTFPIVYMMWMLIGLFTFKQLLGAKDETGTFLDLLCNNTDASTFTKSLSVILIFCVVITVMMKAIKYAMDKGAGTSFVAPLANKVINRAGQLQTKMTSGLYNKTQSVVTGAATRVSNVALGVAKAPLVGAKNLAATGARTVLNNTANGVANMFGAGAARFENPVMQKIMSGVSNKFRDPKVFGKTQKEALDERQKRAEENRAKYEKALKDSGVYKIESKEDFNARTGSTNPADFDKYVENKAKLIMRSQLGRDMMDYKKTGGSKSNEQEILDAMYKVENGVRTFNQGNLWKSIVEKQTYHTTGAGKKDLSFISTRSKRFDQDKRRAKGRVDATVKFARAQDKEMDIKERKKAELKLKKDSLIQAEIEFANIPTSVVNLTSIINDPAFDRRKYSTDVYKYKTAAAKLAAINQGNNPNQNTVSDLTYQMDALAKKIMSGRVKSAERIEKIKKTIDTLEAAV